MPKVLIIEDEASIVKMLTYDLKLLHVDIDTAFDGEAGYQKALSGEYDIILLDLMLPKKNGLDVCKDLRDAKVTSHIIMLTAMDEEFNLIEGFDVGADDYVMKPFSPRELTARIKAALRRKELKESDSIVVHHDLTINRSSYEVKKGDTPIELTLKEFELLSELLAHKNQVISREQLLNHIWGYTYDGDTRVVDVHISKLRDKIDKDQTMIKTIRGIGYKLI